MKKIIFLCVIMLSFISNINGITYRGCDSSEVARMKALINNINISYDYVMEGETPKFSITLNNITPELYFYDLSTSLQYHFQDTNNGEITIKGYNSGISGRYKFYSDNPNCSGINLGTKYYIIPSYNGYYSSPLCEGIDVSICNKWTKVNYTQEEFEKAIKQYNRSIEKTKEENIEYEESFVDKLISIYVRYYIYILISIIVICSVIIVLSKKKNKFNI